MRILDKMGFECYKWTNTNNGKAYIGWASKGYLLRWKEHQRKARIGCKTAFRCAIRKYGMESFEGIVLTSTDTELEIKEIECRMIQEYQTHVSQHGYNMTWGGDGVSGIKRTFTKEHRANLSRAAEGKKLSEDHIQSLVDNHRGMTGKRHSEESKRRSSKSNKGRTRSPEIKTRISKARSLTWIITTPTGGNLSVVNLTKFCRENDLNPSHMYQVGLGRKKHHKGYSCRKK